MNSEKTLILLTDTTSLNDETLYEDLILKVNPERRKDIENNKNTEDKKLSLAGGLLLDLLLKEMKIDGEITHTDNGKPIVIRKGYDKKTYENVYVSLTHCYPYAAAIISCFRCGLDIERRDADLETVARHFYNQKERELCQEDLTIKTDIWCRKECFIKFDKPQDIREIDTTKEIPGHKYVSLPLEGYSFEVLLKDEEYEYKTINLKDLQ